MACKLILLLLIFYLLNGIICEQNKIDGVTTTADDDEDDPFIPTHQWQVVKKGQTVPKGIHVRINLQTGLKEAKLLDPAAKNNALSEVENANEEKEINHNNDKDNSKQVSPEELKQLLKNIKADDEVSNVKHIPKNFKSYEQLKAELGDLNLSVKSDAEILRELFKQLKEVNSDLNLKADEKSNRIIKILQNFEYLVHQIDNANEFVNLNGFTEVIYRNLNNTNVHIKCESLNILGSSVQNNAKAQIYAFETGAIDKLLKVLALDTDLNVKIRTIYALSNLLRRFPLAQSEFIKNGGLNIFTSSFVQSENLKFQLKIITLIYDLLMENKNAHEHTENPDYKEKKRQYEIVDLKNKLNELGWCKIFKAYIIHNLSVENNDHDFVERCLNMMLLLTDTCQSTFKEENLRTVLNKLYKNYEFLSEQEKLENISQTNTADYSSYFTSLKTLTLKLLQNIYNAIRDEL